MSGQFMMAILLSVTSCLSSLIHQDVWSVHDGHSSFCESLHDVWSVHDGHSSFCDVMLVFLNHQDVWSVHDGHSSFTASIRYFSEVILYLVLN